MMLHHNILTKGVHALTWHIRWHVHMQKNVINTPKIPCMSHPPHVFGSALAPRAYNSFINKHKNIEIHDSMLLIK